MQEKQDSEGAQALYLVPAAAGCRPHAGCVYTQLLLTYIYMQPACCDASLCYEGLTHSFALKRALANKLHMRMGNQCLRNVQCAAGHNHLKLRATILGAMSQQASPENWCVASAVYIAIHWTAQK